MGRPRNRPAEFPTDWHWEQEHIDLEKALASAQTRLAEWKSRPEDLPGRRAEIESCEGEIEFIHKRLEHYGWGVKAASTRPAKAQSTRSKE